MNTQIHRSTFDTFKHMRQWPVILIPISVLQGTNTHLVIKIS